MADTLEINNMEIEREEYLCSVSLSMVYDPVKIASADFLYDRNTLETWVEKNPGKATIPQTREPFRATDITPNADLRAEMRQYFQRVMGNEYTGWEVIPDYPQELSSDEIRNLLGDILQLFPSPDAEENLRKMSVESWSNAWKRLTFLRLNLQMNANNRQRFLTDEQRPIESLEEFIEISYTQERKTEESDLFHREILRTILALDLTTHHPVLLRLLSPIAEILEPKQLLGILSCLNDAEPQAVSSTDLRNFAQIIDSFIHGKFREVENTELILRMRNYVAEGFVQIVIYAVGISKSDDRIGVRDAVCEALFLALFHLCHLLQFIESRETLLAFCIHMDLLTYIHEMIEEAVKQESPRWRRLSADDWFLALVLIIAKILYRTFGNADIMTKKEYELYLSFLDTPSARDSTTLRDSVNSILEMFRRFVGVWSEMNSTDE